VVPVTWAPSALGDLKGIAEFISRDSPQYAGLFVQAVFSHVEKMADLPRSGRVVPEYGLDDLREFLHGNYRIVCRIRGVGIEVATLVHGSRPLPETAP